MSYILADYQQDVIAGCYAAYRNGARNVMPVLATGSGKTVIMAHMAHEYEGFGCSIAHRSELVGQLSVALAREGLRHDIIAPDAVIRTIVAAQMDEIGRSFYDTRAKWKVAAVDTILRRELPTTWTKQVGMAHMDEGHHALLENKWGKALSIFDNAYGLLPTATPERADGKGLGRAPVGDGVVDAMVIGSDMRWLINNGYLTGYRIYAPTAADLDMTDVLISATTGDYNADQVRKRVKSSTKIVGDVVDAYKQFANGMKGITFAVDIEHANQIAAAFNVAGVPAAVIHANSSESERRTLMGKFKRGELLQLVNVDLFGEGVDVPSVQVVSMARPTASYGLFTQQFGRALRLLISGDIRALWHTYSSGQRLAHIANSQKPHAIIIDHVGNIIKHNGPPDWRTTPWTLETRTRSRKADDAIPMRACGNPTCLQPFLRIYHACPYCGWEPPTPSDRSKPEYVDGDLVLYDDDLLKQLFGAKNAIDSDRVPIPYGVERNSAIAQRLRNVHAANQSSQKLLRDAMQLALPPSVDERVNSRKFFHEFGVDTLSAMGLTSADADELRQRILQKVTRQ